MREKLIELLAKYFDIGDSYAYNLTRVKSAFACGTMGFDDFEEFDDETVADIADHLIANGVTFEKDNNVPSKWIPVTERLPEKCPQPYDDMTKWCLLYTPVDGCMHIGWYTGKDYRGRDMWRTLSAMRSYQTCTKKVSHWMPLPQPPKGE